MKRVLIIAVLLLAAGVGVWWLLPSGNGEGASSPEQVASSGNENADGAKKPLVMKPSTWTVEPQAKGSLRISGQVKDGEGNPIANAVVTATARHGDDVLSDLSCHCDNACGQKLLECGCPEAAAQLVELVASRTGEAPPLARATTGADGVFHLEGLDNAEVALWADATEGMGLRASATPGDEHADIIVSSGRTVSGVVKGADDQPIAGAYVTAIYSEQSRFFDTATDLEGKFRFEHLPRSGTIAVVAMKEGLLPDDAHVREDSTRELTLGLYTPRSVSGTVTRDGKPVAMAELAIEGEHKKMKRKSDADGKFQLSGLRPGSYELTATSGSDVGKSSLDIPVASDLDGVKVTLGAGILLRGLVRDEAGAPVANATVWSRVEDDYDSWTRAKTDAQGRFELGPVPAADEIWAQADGFVDEKRKLTGEQTRSSIDFSLKRGAVISGVVVDESGSQIIGASISAARNLDSDREPGSNASAKSEDGGFVLKGLIPAEYELTVAADGFIGHSEKVSAPSADVRIQLGRGTVLFGRVTDSSGKGIEGVSVSASEKASPVSEVEQQARDEIDRAMGKTARKQAKTDVKGEFELSGLTAGPHAVVASQRTGEMYMAPGSTRTVTKTLDVPATGRLRVDFKFDAGLKLSGVAVDEVGAPVKQANVRVAGVGQGERSFEGWAKTDEAGRFSVTGLEPGEARVEAWAFGFDSPNPLKARAGDEHLKVVFKRKPQAVGRLLDDTGAPVTRFTLNRHVVETTDGRFSQPVEVRDSVVHLFFQTNGFADVAVEKPQTGDRTDFGDIRLERGRPVTGTVTDAETGTPIAGALIDVDVGELPKAGMFRLTPERGAVKSDAQGHFTLPAVDSRVNSIVAVHEGHLDYIQSWSPDQPAPQIAMKPGAVVEVNLFTRDGKPAPDGEVIPTGPGRVAPYLYSRGGHLTLKGLAPGEWQLRYRGDVVLRKLTFAVSGAKPMTLDWREPSDGVDVGFDPGSAKYSYAMLFFGKLAVDPKDMWSAFQDGDSFVADKNVFRNVPPGDYTLFANNPGAKESVVEVVSVTGAPGQQLRFSPAASHVPNQNPAGY